MRYLAVLTCALIAGCGRRVEQTVDALTSHETQTVVLAREPTTLGPVGFVLRSDTSMKVVGEESGICLVLYRAIALAPEPVMEKYYQEALGGAALSSSVTMKSGQSFQFSRVAKSWSKSGKVTPEEEISACLSCACGKQPSLGSEISKIEVKASSPVRVLGIYWESTNEFEKLK